MLKKTKTIILITLLSSNSIFAKVSQKDLIKGVFFGAGSVANNVEYISKSYALKNKLSGSNLIEAEKITDSLSTTIIKKHPHFSKNFARAVNEGNLTEVLHHIEQADTILTALYEEENYKPNEVGVAVALVAVVAVTLHNVAAVTSVVAVAVAVTVKVALKTTIDEDSLMHREKLSMELSRSLK